MAGKVEPHILFFLGYLLGALTDKETRDSLTEVFRSDEEGSDSVWVYSRMLRDLLTETLKEAGRE